MSALHDDDIKAIVVETLAEQQRFHRDDVDAIVLRAVATTLTSFGIEEEDRREVRADLQHLRRWRKSVEQAQSYTFKAVVTVIATGLVGAVWFRVKVVLGKGCATLDGSKRRARQQASRRDAAPQSDTGG